MRTHNDDKMDIVDTTPETSIHYPPLFRTLSGIPQNTFYSDIRNSFLKQARNDSDANKIKNFFDNLAKWIGNPKDLITQPTEETIRLFVSFAKIHLEDLWVPLLNYFSENGSIHPKNKEFLEQYIKLATSAPMEVENLSTPAP